MPVSRICRFLTYIYYYVSYAYRLVWKPLGYAGAQLLNMIIENKLKKRPELAPILQQIYWTWCLRALSGLNILYDPLKVLFNLSEDGDLGWPVRMLAHGLAVAK